MAEETKLEMNSSCGSILADELGSAGLLSFKSSTLRPVTKKVTAWTSVLIGQSGFPTQIKSA